MWPECRRPVLCVWCGRVDMPQCQPALALLSTFLGMATHAETAPQLQVPIDPRAFD